MCPRAHANHSSDKNGHDEDDDDTANDDDDEDEDNDDDDIDLTQINACTNKRLYVKSSGDQEELEMR